MCSSLARAEYLLLRLIAATGANHHDAEREQKQCKYGEGCEIEAGEWEGSGVSGSASGDAADSRSALSSVSAHERTRGG